MLHIKIEGKKLKKIKLSEILNVINSKTIVNDEIMISYVSDDIRKIKNNSVIFHLNKDEELDIMKFRYLQDCYIICDQPILVDYYEIKDRFFYVSNIKEAYMTFVRYYRSLFKIPVVAVTGTCGKTTTKEMIAQALKLKHNVVHTISSKNALRFNNDYLMSFDDETQYGVFETAITHPGNLTHECDIYRPTIGIITTIGIDHLNWCKTLDIYIRTKGEMLIGLGNKGTLIINNDDKNIKRIDMSSFKGDIITFGLKDGADFRASNLEYGNHGMIYTLTYKGKPYRGYIPGFGEHNVLNALAACAALYKLGYSIEEALSSLSQFKPIRSHTELKTGLHNSIIIDDTWSSNPTSMKAALKVLSAKGKDKTKIAVIGKINYLGKHRDAYYQAIAKMLVKYKINVMISLDEDAKKIGEYALLYGFKKTDYFHFDNDEALVKKFGEILNEKTIVLFKFSMLDKTHQTVLDKVIIK